MPRGAPTVWGSERVWMGAILLVAILLRVIKLDAGLWYDEIDTLVHFTRLPIGKLLTTYPSLNHHVLYSLEAKAAIALFGESAWALRLPAAIFGVAGVWALWLLARQFLSPWGARLSALLLAVSYHHVWFSQNARGYTELQFLSLIATYLFIRGGNASSWRLWLGYGAVSALALYTHLSAAFFLAAHGILYVGLATRRIIMTRWGKESSPKSFSHLSTWWPLVGLAFAGVLAILLYAPLLPDMIETFAAVRAPQTGAAAVATAEWKSPVWAILEVGRSLTYLGPFMDVGVAAAVIIVIVGMAGLYRKQPIVSAIPLIHVPLTLIALVAFSMRVWPRYFLVDLGFICIFLVYGAFVVAKMIAGRLPARWSWIDAPRLGIALTLLGVIVSTALLPKNYRYPKQDFLAARELVERERSPGSEVVTLGLATLPFADYYAPHWASVETLDALEKLQQTHAELWVVYAFPEVTRRRYRDIVNYAAAEFTMVKIFPGTLGGGDVVVLRSIPH